MAGHGCAQVTSLPCPCVCLWWRNWFSVACLVLSVSLITALYCCWQPLSCGCCIIDVQALNPLLTPTAPGLQRPLVWCLQWSHDHRSVSRCLNSLKCWKLPKAVFISFWFLVPVTVVSLFPRLFTWVQHQLFKFPKISCFLKIDKLNAYSAGDVAEQHSRALIKSYSSWCGERMMVPL